MWLLQRHDLRLHAIVMHFMSRRFLRIYFRPRWSDPLGGEGGPAQRPLYRTNDPLPVGMDDLGDLVTAKPRGTIPRVSISLTTAASIVIEVNSALCSASKRLKVISDQPRPFGKQFTQHVDRRVCRVNLRHF